jgi:hypothetical protein
MSQARASLNLILLVDATLNHLRRIKVYSFWIDGGWEGQGSGVPSVTELLSGENTLKSPTTDIIECQFNRIKNYLGAQNPGHACDNFSM